MEENKKTEIKLPMDKTKKKWIIFGIVFAVIIAAVSGTLAYVYSNQNAVASNLLYVFMPKSITFKDNGNDVTMYVEKNKDYKPGSDSMALNAYKFYYFDKDGKRVDTFQGHYETPTRKCETGLGFLVKAKQNLDTFMNFLKIALIAAAVIILVLLILLWYKLWNKKMDEKEALQQQEIERDAERQRYLDRQRVENSLSEKKVKKGKKR